MSPGDAVPAGDVVAEAEARVLRQLVDSLVFEGVVAPRPDATAGPGGLAHEAGGASYRWRARRRLAFGRTTTVGPLTRHGPSGEGASTPTVRRVVAEWLGDVGAAPGRVAAFADELERTVRNDAAALAAWRERPVPAGDASADDLEAWTVAGHPYHPSYKSRVGFDPDDNRRYGPEFAPRVAPVWLALPADDVRVTAAAGIDARTFVEDQLGPATTARFRHLAADADRHDGGRRVWVPAHPWQWRERLAARLAPEVARGRVVVLGEADDARRPQQSIRTLAHATDPARASLKLSLGIVNTSTSRGLAPHTLRNAPLVSDWLQGLVAGDPVLRDELGTSVLGEVLTASYLGPGPALPSGPDGDLGCLWREGVGAHLRPGESAAPFTTLTQRTPAGAPWIAPWLAAHGPERWARRLLEVAVTPVAHLLWAHGVALEAHAQNLLLVHRDGWPERLVVRDLHDGIRFSPAHLAAPGDRPPLAPTPAAHLRVNRNSFVEADEPAAVRDFVADCLFFVNLAELGFVLHDDGHLDEARFWGLARRALDRHRARLDREPAAAARTAAFDLLAPTVGIEQLTTRRLLPDDRVRVVAAANPLARRPAATDPAAAVPVPAG